jgi:hypothetical protein
MGEFIKFQPKPGIVRDTTRYANLQGWYDCNLIRFKNGFPQTMGGWEKVNDTAFYGSCRDMKAWSTIDNSILLFLGTHLKCYIEEGQELTDITPLRTDDAALGTNPFTSTAASTTVRVTHSGHGSETGDFVTFAGATTFDGIPAAELNTNQQITKVDANTYTITVDTAASAGASGGGASVTADYEIRVGSDILFIGQGFGAGSYSGQIAGEPSTTMNDPSGISDSDTSIILTDASSFPSSGTVLIEQELITYSGISTNTLTGCTRGTNGTTAASHADGTIVLDASNFVGWGEAASSTVAGENARLWSSDNFGEDLIFCARNSSLYYYDYSTRGDDDGRGVLLSTLGGASDVPTVASLVLVSDVDRHVIAFGCNAIGSSDQDKLLIRWSDAESAVDWTPSTTNSSGDLRLSFGSEIITAYQTRQEIVVWTDMSVHSMPFLGPPYYFGLQTLATGVTIAGPKAKATLGDVVYWMGAGSNFYAYDGRVRQLDCPIENKVFGEINRDQIATAYAGTIENETEIIWFYQSTSGTNNDMYVIYNVTEKAWYFGSLSRTAWLDRGLSRWPRATEPGTLQIDIPASFLYYHESDIDDGSTNPPQSLNAYIESAPFELGNGDRMMFCNRVVPDLTFRNSDAATKTVDFTLKVQDYPGAALNTDSTAPDTATQTATTPVEQYTNQFFVRMRGRTMVLRVDSSTAGVEWQLGVPRFEVRSDGRR